MGFTESVLITALTKMANVWHSCHTCPSCPMTDVTTQPQNLLNPNVPFEIPSLPNIALIKNESYRPVFHHRDRRGEW